MCLLNHSLRRVVSNLVDEHVSHFVDRTQDDVILQVREGDVSDATGEVLKECTIAGRHVENANNPSIFSCACAKEVLVK